MSLIETTNINLIYILRLAFPYVVFFSV